MTPLLLLVVLAFIVSVDVRIIAPVLPSISASLESSAGAVGLAMTTYSFAYGTGQLVYGPVSDRYGRLAVVRVAGLGFSLCTALSAACTMTWQFITARLLAGAFAGAVIPLTLVYIADTFEYDERQIMLGRLAVVTSAGLAFSASIGGTVAHFVSWQIMLLGYSLLALVPVALMFRVDSPRPPRRPGSSEGSAGFVDFLMDGRARDVY